MKLKFRNPFILESEDKKVPGVANMTEVTREGIHKEVIPNFMYKPPFGYPRFVDLATIRILAASPYVDMCITTIIDEVCSIEYDIVAEDETGKVVEGKEEEILHVKTFFDNPNTNKESWEYMTRVFLRDVLETDSGIIVKVFNRMGEMVEMVARDGITFTKNPDMHGMMTNRDDLLFDAFIDNVEDTPENEMLRNQVLSEFGHISAWDVRERAAYFQYGWITGARPIPFGKKEIVWFERNPRSDSRYGRGAVEILQNVISTLIYAIEHNLEYFTDNSIPPGVLGLEGSNKEELDAFADLWKEQQRKKDTQGRWKKRFHHLPMVNKIPKFEKLGFTNAELELFEGQKWWSKIVWACFGVTATELGYTEDAKGLANQIVQSNIFKKRAINPLLRMIEYKINTEIISEFGYEGIKFKYQRFDVEEETKKANLYKIQTDVGIKTVNEIRVEEGLDEVEWGDDDPKRNQGNNFSFGENPEAQEQERTKKESQNEEDEKKKKKEKEEKDIESKPGEGHSDKWWEMYHELIKEGHSKESASKITNSKISEKAMVAENPLIPKEGEVMDSDKLKRSIVYLLRINEKKLKDLIEKEIGKDKLMDIKDIDDIAKAIKSLITFEGLKNISNKVIMNTFMEGWDGAEKQLDRNFMINKDAITFIQDYTFNNIVDMTEEIKNDLRAELKRGIMAGEGVSNLKQRVENVFDVGENRAEMIARTETNRAENQGKFQGFKSSGEDFLKRWISAKDDRTSDLCLRLHGQTVGLNDNFDDKKTGWQGPVPPAHVNCRSTVIYLSKEETAEQKATKEKLLGEDIDLKMKEKEMEIKNRKEILLKKLEADLDGGNTNIPGQREKE